MAKQVIRAKATFVEGLNGPNTFAFSGQSPKGNRVVVEVEPDTVKALAKFMEYTDSAGHAAWHLNRPECPAPCGSCEKVEVEHEVYEPTENLNLSQTGDPVYEAACVLSNF